MAKTKADCIALLREIIKESEQALPDKQGREINFCAILTQMLSDLSQPSEEPSANDCNALHSALSKNVIFAREVRRLQRKEKYDLG